jgi:hypothetical protein
LPDELNVFGIQKLTLISRWAPKPPCQMSSTVFPVFKLYDFHFLQGNDAAKMKSAVCYQINWFSFPGGL